MSFFNNVVNALPGEWVAISDDIFNAPTTEALPVTVSPGLRYSYTVNGVGDYLGPYEAGNEVPIEDGWIVAFWAKAPSEPGKDGFYWVKIGTNTYHVTVSTRSGEINPSLPLTNVDVTLCEADGAFIVGAVVEIKLVGAADTAQGTINQTKFLRKTNGSGIATFALWANQGNTSNAHYEIRCKHPRTGKAIYSGEKFTVAPSVIPVKIESLLDIVNQ